MKKALSIIETIIFLAIIVIPIAWIIVLFGSASVATDDFSSAGPVEMMIKSFAFLLLELLSVIAYIIVRVHRKRNGEEAVIKKVFRKIKKRYIVAGISGIVLIAAFCAIYYGQNLLLYYPDNSEGSAYYLRQRESFQEIKIEGDNVQYGGWLYKSPEGSENTIIYFGGNAESSANTLCGYDFEEWWETFQNYNFLMVDYPGYGLSQGETTKENLLKMAQETFRFVEKNDDLNQEIVVMGYSLGTGIASYIASEYPVDKLILLAPYDKMENVYNEYVNIFHGPLKYLVRNDYDSMACAREIALRPLIIASKADEVIPYELSATLAEGFSNGAEFMTLEGVSHSDFMYQKNVRDKIETFLNSEEEAKSYN